MKPIPPAHHKTHRRTFVKGLATAMAAQTAPLIANSVDSDKKKLGLAVVGLGGYATGCIAPEVSACSHVRLAGVITGSSEKGSEWAKQYTFPEDAIYGYDQIDKLAADDRIDIVHIACPTPCTPNMRSNAPKRASMSWWKSRWRSPAKNVRL